MDNGTGITPVMPIGGGYGDGFGGGGFWIFALLILAMMGGNGFGGWGGNGNSNAVQADVNRGFDNQNLQAQTRDILSAVNAQGQAGIATTNQTFHDSLSAMQNLYNETARDMAGLAVGQANLLAKENECCCSQLRAIDGVNYNNALNTASINANTTAQTQKILDALAENKIEALQAQVNQLQMQNALNGVVRYPTNTYYSVPSPCFNGCGCGNI